MRSVSGIELVLDAKAELAEGPHWDALAEQLLWVDVEPGIVHRFDPSTGEDVANELGPTVGAVVPTSDGGMVAATGQGFRVLDSDGAVRHAVDVESETAGTRMNDGKCDSAGRFWAGSMVTRQDQPRAALYRLDPDMSVHRMIAGVMVSNGLGWSLDATRMYYIDSASGGVDELSFDLASGGVGARRRLITIPSGEGDPDGMTVDADGCLWVALWGGGQVRRFTPDGRLDAVVDLPVSLVTSCTFGGASLDVLYVTTASADLSAELRAAQPLAGGVFAVDAGVSGLAPTRFG